MRFSGIFMHRLHSLLRRSRADANLQREIDLHLEQLTKEYTAAGMSETEARLTALREFGSIEATKEHCRDMRRVNVVEDLCKDLAYAFRLLMKSPGFTVTAASPCHASPSFSVLPAIMADPCTTKMKRGSGGSRNATFSALESTSS